MKIFPEDLTKRIKEFILGRKTGKVAMHINQGRVEAWEITEHGRIKGQTVERKDKSA